MISSRNQISPCPVCHQADRVEKMQVRYQAGDHHFTPPPMPESRVSMIKYICAGMLLIVISAITTLVLLAADGWGWFPSTIALILGAIQGVVTLLFIVTALVLAFIAFRRISEGDEEARRLYPIWDRAMANWERMRYCTRDRVVFDSRTNQILSEAAIHTQLSMSEVAPLGKYAR